MIVSALDRLIRDPALRFGIRATISALIAFSLIWVIQAPLHGLWTALTAIVVLQMSAGGAIRATINYVLGTLAGAIYASILSLLIPHDTPSSMAGVLALAIGPLAWAVARSPLFRVAPFTAVIVPLLAGQFGQAPATAALVRLIEVAFGGGVAVAVSLLILPDPADSVGRRQAVGALLCLVDTLPKLLASFRERVDTGTDSAASGSGRRRRDDARTGARGKGARKILSRCRAGSAPSALRHRAQAVA